MSIVHLLGLFLEGHKVEIKRVSWRRKRNEEWLTGLDKSIYNNAFLHKNRKTR